MKDQHDCPFCVTVSWSCILFIGTVHTGKRLSVSGTLPILKFFASAASGFFSTDLSKD